MNEHYEAIVVGSGAGGAAAAYRLAKAGRRVLIVEKGGALANDGSTLDVDKVVHQGIFKSREPWLDGAGRQLVPEEYFNLGGKTKWYGAALLRFGADEFRADPAMHFLGWPIGLEDLAPYYDEAEQLLGVREFEREPDLARIAASLAKYGWKAKPLPMGLAPDILKHPNEARHFDGFSSVRSLKSDAETSMLARISTLSNVTLVTGNPVVDLLGDETDPHRVRGVKLADGALYRASSVVLAAGALHSPRLLQRYLEKTGLHTSLPAYGQVGRNLKLHLLTAVLAVSPSRKSDLLRKTTILLSELFPHSSVQPLGFDGELIATLVPRFVPRWFARQLGERAYGFFLQTEDGSDRRNRVVDAVGETGTASILDYAGDRVHGSHSEHRRLVRGLRTDLAKAGYMTFAQRIPVHGTAHACGTLVAGSNPADSVVDASGLVHGMRGLYVVDGSILPRSSRVNPSLTIYAWALRVADGMLTAQRAVA